MYSFSGFMVLLVCLGLAYYYIMKWYDIRQAEIEEKINDAKEIGELDDKVKKVNVDKLKKQKGNIKKFENS